MELISPKYDTWKYFVAGSLVGFSLLLLLAYQTHPYTILLAHRTTTTRVEFVPMDETGATINAIKPMEHFNITVNIPEEKIVNVTDETDSTIDAIKPLEHFNITVNIPEEKMVNITDESDATSNVVKPSEKFNITVNNPENITNEDNFEKQEANTVKKCDMFEGRWVYKPDDDPSYDSVTCPFIEEKMSCKKNGRPDFEYQKWRWEAPGCDIPLFNGTDMLERLRNKRVILVGDSLNRNMWESLACLLYSSSPSNVEVSAENQVYKFLKAKDYNCTVEFYWSPFLVEFIEKHASGRKILVLDKLSPNFRQWKGADVMVFNSGHWWLHGGKMRSWDLFEYEGKLIEDMPIELAYERAMTTWETWINQDVNPNKTTVFFRSLSAVHQSSNDWCYNTTQPIAKDSLVSSSQRSDILVEVIKRVIQGITKLQVKYLNITKLSQYRRDAHPSIYRSSQWRVLIKKFENSLSSYADCSHWCLPGLPDTWNRLLYASLSFDYLDDLSSS